MQERVFSHYSISTNNEFILKNFILQDKPQDIIDRVNAERELEALEVSTIEEREKQKEKVANWREEGLSESEIIKRLTNGN